VGNTKGGGGAVDKGKWKDSGMKDFSKSDFDMADPTLLALEPAVCFYLAALVAAFVHRSQCEACSNITT
jgi:hypothetical protein